MRAGTPLGGHENGQRRGSDSTLAHSNRSKEIMSQTDDNPQQPTLEEINADPAPETSYERIIRVIAQSAADVIDERIAELRQDIRAMIRNEVVNLWRPQEMAYVDEQIERVMDRKLLGYLDIALADHVASEHPQGSLSGQIDSAISARLQAMGHLFERPDALEAFLALTRDAQTLAAFLEQQVAARVDDAIDQELSGAQEDEAAG
jgi:hypothetical protein